MKSKKHFSIYTGILLLSLILTSLLFLHDHLYDKGNGDPLFTTLVTGLVYTVLIFACLSILYFLIKLLILVIQNLFLRKS